MGKKKPDNISANDVYKSKEFVNIPFQLNFKKGYKAPIPDPNILMKYNKIIPDGAERVLQIVEKQNEHKMFIEKQFMNSEISKIRIGLVFAFSIAIIILGLGTYLIINGNEEVGSLLFGVTLVSLVKSFIRGRLRTKNSRKIKKE